MNYLTELYLVNRILDLEEENEELNHDIEITNEYVEELEQKLFELQGKEQDKTDAVENIAKRIEENAKTCLAFMVSNIDLYQQRMKLQGYKPTLNGLKAEALKRLKELNEGDKNNERQG